MRNSQSRATLTAFALFCFVSPAAADIVTNLWPPSGTGGWATATAINSAGWVIGGSVDQVGLPLLWIPDGQSSVIGTPLAAFWDQFGSAPLDIHDNGDVLLDLWGAGLLPSAECASTTCIPGGPYAVVHAGGGPLLSRTDYYHFNSEWLADLNLWGSTLPRQMNVRGQYIRNVSAAGTGECAYGACYAQLVTPEIPEPSSLVLLMTAAGGIALVLRKRL